MSKFKRGEEVPLAWPPVFPPEKPKPTTTPAPTTTINTTAAAQSTTASSDNATNSDANETTSTTDNQGSGAQMPIERKKRALPTSTGYNYIEVEVVSLVTILKAT